MTHLSEILQPNPRSTSDVYGEIAALLPVSGAVWEQPPLPLDKFTARSGLQKCIRRGLTVQALGCARYLFGLDPGYMWRSLATIAVEDVGLGHLDAVSFTRLGASGLIAKMGLPSWRTAAILIDQMCAAPKSRAACEISIYVDMDQTGHISQMADRPWEQIKHEALHGMSLSGGYGALCALANKVPAGLPKAKLPPDAKQQILGHMAGGESGLSMSARRAAMLSFETPIDSMALAMWPLVRYAMYQRHALTVKPDSLPPSIELKGLPSATFDMHTMHGKMALKALWTNLSKKHPEIAALPAEGAAKALGAVVFVEEGGQVDRRISTPALEVVKQFQDTSLCKAYGVPEALITPIREIVRDNFEVLNQKRVWALGAKA